MRAPPVKRLSCRLGKLPVITQHGMAKSARYDAALQTLSQR